MLLASIALITLLVLAPAARALRQVPCPQAGVSAGPAPTPFPPAPAAGAGSRADILGAAARAAAPFAPTTPEARRAAAAAVRPMRAQIAAAAAASSNSTDCLAALLMYEFALALRPDLAPNVEAFESLQLDILCGVTPPARPALAERPAAVVAWSRERLARECGPPGAPAHVYVDASRGDDARGDGHPLRPLRTIHAALAVSRLAEAATAAPPPSRRRRACVVLRGGVHYLGGRTAELSAADAGLAVVGMPGDEPAWVSGGTPLLGMPPWRPYNVAGASNIWVTDVPAALPIDSLMGGLNTLAPLTRLANSQFPNFDIETGSADGEVQAPWEGGGAVSEWLKPGLFPLPTVFWKSLAGMKNDSTMDCYNHFSTGSGGACAHWKGKGADQNYFCGNASDGGWVEVDAYMNSLGLMLLPVGMTYNSSFVPNIDKWRLPPLADVHDWSNAPTLTVWQGSPGGGGGWYNNRGAIISHNPATHFMNLSADGVWPSGFWQGGRTWHTVDAPQGKHDGPLIGGNWHINGVFEELDFPGEYYFNYTTRQLYFFYNVSVLPPGQAPLPPLSPPPPALVLVAPQLEVFFNLSGSASAPVVDVAFAGLGFRDQREAMLEAWVIPSGGDWALRRAGAVYLDGTERVSVTGCAFVRTDGNAILLSGYNRNATISANSFEWTGMSAVALIGDCDQDDCTMGTMPMGTVMASNVVREVGVVEKQSSALFIGKSALTRVEGNIFYNGPRAFINVNDAGGGGHNFTQNAIWNSCRESGDHGPLNSWNRMAMATRIRTQGGDATYAAADTETHRNYVDAGYGGSQAFDNDDGSAFMVTHDNFFLHSDGFKMDYGGHDSAFHDNVVVVRRYDGQACINAGDFVPGHEDRIYNNSCVLPEPGGSNGQNAELVAPFIGSTACDGLGPGQGVLVAYANRYYTKGANATTHCDEGQDVRVVDLPPPMEAGSSSHPLPDSETIIAWGREKIGL